MQTTPRHSQTKTRILSDRSGLVAASNAMRRSAPPPDARETPEIPASTVGLATANIRYLSAIIGQLIELRTAPDEEDDYGTLRATKESFNVACEILTNAAIDLALEVSRPIPRGRASTDSTGGIRVEWVRSDRAVHLVIPSDAEKQGYIYVEKGDAYSTKPATAQTLADSLKVVE